MTYKQIELPNNLRPLTEKFIKDIIDNFDENDKLNSLDTLSLIYWLIILIPIWIVKMRLKKTVIQ